jgi:hypothetical protein
MVCALQSGPKYPRLLRFEDRLQSWEIRIDFLALQGLPFKSEPPPSSSGEGQQIGKILSVRKVLENRYFVSRYPQIHYYLLYFAVRISDQTYCAEYETPVLDEI